MPETIVRRPAGLRYEPEFLSVQEESDLLAELERLQFNDVVMHGVVARRRVVHFGWDYGYSSWKIEPGPPIPSFLETLRERCAAEVPTHAEHLEQVLVAWYPEGAAIGWHRDAPMFGDEVAGVSLLGDCEMRFRETDRGAGRYALLLQRRSFYLLSAEARTRWQHSIPAVRHPRYSITFRSLRKRQHKA